MERTTRTQVAEDISKGCFQMAFEWLKDRAEILLMQDGLCSNFVWHSTTLRGTRSVLKRQDAATLSGMDVGYSFTILIPSTEWLKVATKPRPLKDRVQVDGNTYLVLALEEDVAHNIRVHLGAEYE